MPYKFREGLKQLRVMRAAKPDGRGRHTEYTDEDHIRLYVEIEAHARLRANGKIDRMLRLPCVRVGTKESSQRLDQAERSRLRKLHQNGKREAEHWRRTLFNGTPHPQWAVIQHRIEARVEELKQQTGSLFFLKIS
ncbi:MAG: hypothetical protein H7312_14360 [Tardiphaga sp.]|nr:hypothetical protein [Tardiphaga sp.]